MADDRAIFLLKWATSSALAQCGIINPSLYSAILSFVHSWSWQFWRRSGEGYNDGSVAKSNKRNPTVVDKICFRPSLVIWVLCPQPVVLQSRLSSLLKNSLTEFAVETVQKQIFQLQDKSTEINELRMFSFIALYSLSLLRFLLRVKNLEIFNWSIYLLVRAFSVRTNCVIGSLQGVFSQ